MIVIGISVIFKKELLDMVLWTFFIVILVAYSFFVKDTLVEPHQSDEMLEEEISFAMEEGMEEGKLILDIGASNFEIDSASFDLLRLEQDGAYNYKVESKAGVEEVYIEGKDEFLKNTGKRRDLFLALNNDIAWEMDFDMGAVNGNINLEDIIVDYIDLEVGAGNLELSLGGKNEFTLIDIEAGASKVVLNFPEEVGIKVDFEGGLNTSNLNDIGLIETENNKFESKDYNDASSQFEINVEMGVGNLEINYY